MIIVIYCLLFTITFVIFFYATCDYFKPKLPPTEEFIACIILSLIFPISWFIVFIWYSMEVLDGKKKS